ncbi:MAG: polysaccharide deacetylase [Lachnospiraceae bacterium]|nr:polysaccharide deacetylase [Lachnospiraceae bacterium]
MSQVFMRFPGGKLKALTLSYDDGVEQDRKLIEIMKKYGLKGTFNLNSGLYAPEGTVYPKGQIHRRMTEAEVSVVYAQEGIEVAVHGFTHPWLDHMPVNMCTKDLIDDREKLESQFGVMVRGMAYPFGTYSDEVVDCMKSVGIVYSRTVESSHHFDMPHDWMRLPATCHHNDPELMELARRFVEESSWGRPYMFYLWGHSYEFEENDNWEVIEEFAEYVSGRDDIWHATNIEIYDYQDAFKQLQFSVDGSIVHNPTAYELWFFLNGKEYSIKPGETLKTV